MAGSGSRLSAVASGGYVWISADAGATWATEPPAGTTPAPTVPMAPAPTPAPSASPRAWSAIASSADGARLAATVSSGSIYTSADSGASWTEDATAGARNWVSIAMSADGQRLAAVEGSIDLSYCDVYGSLWTSSDFGASWTEQAGLGSNCWRGVAMSGDGATVAAVVDQGSIWVSTDYGSSWSETSDPAGGDDDYYVMYNWRAVAVSSDGTTLAAAYDMGVWMSYDSGATWSTDTSGSYSWSDLRDIAMSDDGSLMAVVEYSGALYTSSDHYSWNSPSSMSDDGAVTHDWQAIAMSADGGTIVAVAAEDYNYMGGGVYLSTDFGSTWSTVVFGGSASLNLVDVAVAGSGSRLSAVANGGQGGQVWISADAGTCLLYTSPSPRDKRQSRMPSSA